MCQGVHREVFPYWWRGDPCAPAEGKVDGGEAYCQVPGRVLGPTQILCLFFSSYFLFFFSFFFDVFIIFRYKKLRAGLAMERTKSINQNIQQKKPYS